MLKNIKNILYIGMPVADILISGKEVNMLVQKFDMRFGERNMLDAVKISEFEQIISQNNSNYKIEVVAGGSMANTACSVNMLCDIKSSFFAATSNDKYGETFKEGLTKAEVQHVPKQRCGNDTSRSYVITDIDGERAIARYFGDSMSCLSIKDFIIAIDNCDLILLEGELPGLPDGEDLWFDILKYAKQKDKMIGFSLFGAEQITQHRNLFMQTISDYANLVFGNESKLSALFEGMDENFEQQCQNIYNMLSKRNNKNAILCISHGDKSPYLASCNGIFRTPPEKVENLVNTLGAGDAFMAGALSGLLNGMGEQKSLELGHKVASVILQQSSPQLTKDIASKL